MTVYYENEAAVDAALQAAKTPDDVRKIAQDLETRMAPRHWIQKGCNSRSFSLRFVLICSGI